MAHVDQLLQIDLKQLPLRLRRLALGLHQFFPSFQTVCCQYREILSQKRRESSGLVVVLPVFQGRLNSLANQQEMRDALLIHCFSCCTFRSSFRTLP
jgi:hypothetical protein